MERLTFRLARGLLLALFATALAACSSGGGSSSPPPPGTLTGTVTDASTTPATVIVGASVTVFNATTNTAVATLTSGATGKYSTTLTAGTYYVKVTKQGFDPVPPAALEPVPLALVSGQTTTNNIQMFPAANLNTGWISGKVSIGTSGKGGVLVVATNGSSASSALSDASGNYVIYNVPVAATYSVTGHLAGYSATTAAPVIVSQGVATTGVNLALSANAVGQVPVSFNLIAQTGVTAPSTMVVSLLHPLTRETIPGLVQSLPHSSSISFLLTGVADGSYLVRASYANDTIVVDPDSIRKFGEPSVTVAGGTPTPNPVDIKATGAVGLVSPTNAITTTVPEIVTAGTSPTFTWNAYPTTSDYVVEVMDATTGAVIWGGFSGTGDAMVKNVTTTATSIVFNDDGLATSALLAGHVYRWRIYASKNDNTVLGWHLISASEDQRGLIKAQ